MKYSILILGASGLLGTPLTNILKSRGCKVYTVSQSQRHSDFRLDATNKSELDKVVNTTKPDIILNLIAITDVDWCESHIESAYKVHVTICKYLADYSQRYGTKIIHVSTDHIYNGNNSEENKVSPQNVYALTKLMGELELVKADATILRTNFFGKSQTPNKESLTDVMYNIVSLGKPLILFKDVYFSPLSINTLCELIVVVINNWNPGTYNIGSNKGLSKSDFILKFIKYCKLSVSSVEVKSIDSLEFSAKRPKDMRMNCHYFESSFGIKLPDLSDEIENVAREFNE